jgi:hypothetical protein
VLERCAAICAAAARRVDAVDDARLRAARTSRRAG